MAGAAAEAAENTAAAMTPQRTAAATASQPAAAMGANRFADLLVDDDDEDADAPAAALPVARSYSVAPLRVAEALTAGADGLRRTARSLSPAATYDDMDDALDGIGKRRQR